MFTNEVASVKKKLNLFTFKDLEVLYNITIMFVFFKYLQCGKYTFQ